MRNIGFVMCQWQYRGTLINRPESKITGEGRTYDNKLYTFKEANYHTTWLTLEILAKRLERGAALRNLPLETDEDVKAPVLAASSSGPSLTQPAEPFTPPQCNTKPGLCLII
jgi:hypothetical protein